MSTVGNALVFDVGGTHISAAVVRDSSLKLQGTRSVPVNSHGSKDEVLETLEQLGRQVLAECNLSPCELEGLSLAIPGPFDYIAGIGHGEHKYEGLYGVNVRTELSRRYSVSPEAVTFINDAGAYLLGEARAGAAIQSRRAVGITLGTGIGSAFAVDGKILTSGKGVPPGGEIWNLPWANGIVEDLISARAIQATYYSLAKKTIEVRDIAVRASFDHAAGTAMGEMGSNLGKVLRFLSSEFLPDCVVLGGAISRSASCFLPQVKAELSGIEVALRQSSLFDLAALKGAGAQWFDTQQQVSIKDTGADTFKLGYMQQ